MTFLSDFSYLVGEDKYSYNFKKYPLYNPRFYSIGGRR